MSGSTGVPGFAAATPAEQSYYNADPGAFAGMTPTLMRLVLGQLQGQFGGIQGATNHGYTYNYDIGPQAAFDATFQQGEAALGYQQGQPFNAPQQQFYSTEMADSGAGQSTDLGSVLSQVLGLSPTPMPAKVNDNSRAFPLFMPGGATPPPASSSTPNAPGGPAPTAPNQTTPTVPTGAVNPLFTPDWLKQFSGQALSSGASPTEFVG